MTLTNTTRGAACLYHTMMKQSGYLSGWRVEKYLDWMLIEAYAELNA